MSTPSRQRASVLIVTGAILVTGAMGISSSPVQAATAVLMLPWMTNAGPPWHSISGNTYGCDTHVNTDYYAIDFGLNFQPVGAAQRGVIYATGYDPLGGNYIYIHGNDGTYSYYGHLSSFNVSTNQRVREGDQIATSGNSGSGAIGAHLHFRVTSGGPTSTPVKPEPMGATSGPSPSFGHWGYSLDANPPVTTPLHRLSL